MTTTQTAFHDASRTSTVVFVGLLAILALALGVSGAFIGWDGQLVLLSVGLPALLLLVDYRVGLWLAIVLLPYASSPLVPGDGMLKLTNVLLLGVLVSYVVHWIKSRLSMNAIPVPLDRQLAVYYILPVTVAAFIGSTHFSEIASYFLLQMKMNSLTLFQYWVTFYVKPMLYVGLACVLSGSVGVSGKGVRYIVATVISAVLFVAAEVVVVVSSGASLQQLQNARDLLKLLGHHNTEAGYLLMVAAVVTGFVREHTVNRAARLALLVALISMVGGLLLTFSRGPVLGALVALAFYVWRFRKPGVVFAAATFTLLVIAIAPDAIVERLMIGIGETPTHLQPGGEADALTQGRTWIWSVLAPDILQSPVYGRGVASTMWSTAAKSGLLWTHNPHNLLLNALLDIGIAGAIMIVAFYVYVWRMFNRLSKDLRLSGVVRGYFLGCAGALLATLAYGTANGYYYPSEEQLYLWVAIGLGFGYQRWLGREASTKSAGARADAVARNSGRPSMAVRRSGT
jgi:O-antigen ligase